jgi:hypothetical protein
LGGPLWVALGGVGSGTCASNPGGLCETCDGGSALGPGGRGSGCGREYGMHHNGDRCRSCVMECPGGEEKFPVCRW